jgi:hypothetical protein
LELAAGLHMRGTHFGMPEILKAYERDGSYFGVVRIMVSEETAAFEFGLDRAGYGALRRVLQTRPFSNMPGIEYRYFFTGSYGRKKLGEEPVTLTIRIEQGNDATSVEVDGPTTLASNLRWFMELKDLRDVGPLKRIE